MRLPPQVVALFVLPVALALGMGRTPAQEPAADPAQTHCYTGVSDIQTADGSWRGQAAIWLWRSLDPSTSRITERIFMLSRGHEPERHEMVMQVDGSHFTATWEGRSTEGELSGAPWEWTSWRSETVTPEGERISSADELIPSGIRSLKVITGSDGEVLFTGEDRLDEVPCLQWEQEVPQVDPPGSPPEE